MRSDAIETGAAAASESVVDLPAAIKPDNRQPAQRTTVRR